MSQASLDPFHFSLDYFWLHTVTLQDLGHRVWALGHALVISCHAKNRGPVPPRLPLETRQY